MVAAKVMTAKCRDLILSLYEWPRAGHRALPNSAMLYYQVSVSCELSLAGSNRVKWGVNSPSQNLHSLYEITFQYEYNCKYFSAKFFLAKFAVNLYEFLGIVQQNLHVNGYSSLRNRF